MLCYLFRHGHKQHLPHNNPPLSEQGLQQAEQLAELVTAGALPRPKLCLSSPKQRAQETFLPLSRLSGAGIGFRIEADLDERRNNESEAQFFARVKNLLSWIAASGASGAGQTCIYAVSHADWVMDALAAIPCTTDLTQDQYHWWSPAQYMGFRVEDGMWELVEYNTVNAKFEERS